MKKLKIRKALLLYDLLAYVIVIIAVLFIHKGNMYLKTVDQKLMQALLGAVCILGMRLVFGIYKQVWRYGGSTEYLKLMLSDFIALILFYLVGKSSTLFTATGIVYAFAIVGFTCLISLAMRMLYVYIYRQSGTSTAEGKIYRLILKYLAAVELQSDDSTSEYDNRQQKIKLAIVGAGRTGVSLASDLQNSIRSPYRPVCFIETDEQKIGRKFNNIQVLDENTINREVLEAFGVQEIVFALPGVDAERRNAAIKKYGKMGYKLKIYDYPDMQSASVSKMQLREFEIEDVLFRASVELKDKATRDYYAGKTIMITGGGGSIGSEMCRQLAKMDVKSIVILDIAENGAYEIQQAIKQKYGNEKTVCVEIISICDKAALEQVFIRHKPDVIIHAAAHKHVPLMETNVVEAISNNVFGTLNLVEMAEKYGVQRFMMVSTDKAVNPTNVMGATKRMCEMIVQSRSQDSSVIYSATRFGNVLGSAGSVVPLFKKQIAHGGPVTITDKRIVRYFMTIPEACQLVLKSGPMAQNGELFVLDMGKPVKIIDLAENMIRLSGLEPYRDIDIVETGLRPGEKLYEELLVKEEKVDRTDDERIYIEHDSPLSRQEIADKLCRLSAAVESQDNKAAREALEETVGTYKPGGGRI